MAARRDAGPGFERIIRESDMALQVCTAGNLRTGCCAPASHKSSKR